MEANVANKLVQELLSATGLPEELIGQEFQGLAEKYQTSTENVGLEELRQLMADYLQDVMLELKENSK